MNKRFQIFVSSTYTDLTEERQAVAQTLLKMQCIPSGMEWFPADTEEQWAVIRRVIDDCDYYVLIIGGRYGSKTAEGLSYTEKEFDYALLKGLPVLVFCHADPQNIPVRKSETDADARAKLETFRQKAMTGRTVNFWSNPDELAGKVAVAVNTAITTKEAIGWVRGDQLTSTETLTDLNTANKRVQELQDCNRELEKAIIALKPSVSDIAGLDEPFTIKLSGRFRSGERAAWKVEMTWSDLFGIIAATLIVPQEEWDVHTHLANSIRSSFLKKRVPDEVGIDREDFQTVKIQMMALGLIKVTGNGEFCKWILTMRGQETLFQIRTIKSIKSKKRSRIKRPAK